MAVRIEPITRAADLAHVVDVERALDPAFPDDAGSLAAGDAALATTGVTPVRTVAFDNRPIGHAAIRPFPTALDGATWQVRVGVLTVARRSGVGTALHERAVRDLPNPRRATLFGYVPADEGGVPYARSLGYSTEGRMVESTVDPRSVDPIPPPPDVAIASIAEIARHDTSWLDRLYDLFRSVIGDAPFPIEERPMTAEHFRHRVVESGTADLDAILVAVVDGAWVGYTTLRPSTSDPSRWSQMFTGVEHAYRGRGVASALKRAGLRAAAAKGATEVGTLNHGTNEPIRRINERLGFTPTRTIHLMVRRPEVM